MLTYLSSVFQSKSDKGVIPLAKKQLDWTNFNDDFNRFSGTNVVERFYVNKKLSANKALEIERYLRINKILPLTLVKEFDALKIEENKIKNEIEEAFIKLKRSLNLQ